MVGVRLPGTAEMFHPNSPHPLGVEQVFIPPTLMENTTLGAQFCLLDVVEAGSSKDTQKAATGFRAARVFGRIATGDLHYGALARLCDSHAIHVALTNMRLLLF